MIDNAEFIKLRGRVPTTGMHSMDVFHGRCIAGVLADSILEVAVSDGLEVTGIV